MKSFWFNDDPERVLRYVRRQHFIGTTTAILAAAAISAGTTVASGVIGSKAAKGAAKGQAAAANSSAEMQLQAARESNALQKEMFEKNQANLQPYLETGGVANTKLRELLNLGYPEYGKTFQGPQFDPSKVQFDPGFQYRMDQSQKAIERFAAKSGAFLSGGTAQKLVRNAQDMTSQEYGAAYNRAAGQQQVDYAQKLQEFLNDYNIFSDERAGRYDQLARAASLGADTTGQLNQLGQNYAATVGGTNIDATRGAAGSLESGANATAAGRVGAANAWTGALASGANNIQQMLTLQMLLNPNANMLRQPSTQNFYNPSSLQPNYARG